MKHHLTSIPGLVLALLLSACATDEGKTQAKASTPGVQTEEQAGVNAQGNAATSMTTTRVTATVADIDQATRMVTLVGPQGNSVTVQAGDQVRNLDQVQVGNKVTVEYTEGILANTMPPGSSQDDLTKTEAMLRAAPGERPAGAVGQAVTAIVVIEFVDPIRNVVQFKGPLGKTRVVKVMKPEFRTMLKTLKPGDRVALSYFEAVALSVQPASN